MRVVNIHGPGDVRLDPSPDRPMGPGDVLLRVGACGVCGSDLTFIRNGGAGPLVASDEPMPLGHEASGTVLAVGPDVEGIAPGERVVLNPMMSESVIGNGGPEGAFTEKLLVRNAVPGKTLLKIPEGMDFELAALTEPLAVALHSVNRGKVRAGDRAVVFGAGPIGLGITYWLARRGARDIVVADLSPYRLDQARAFGATAVIRADQDDIKARLHALHGRIDSPFGALSGTDVYFDAAGAPQVIPSVVELAKPDARLVVTAVYSRPIPLDLTTFLTREMHVTSAIGYPVEFGEVIAELRESPEDLRRMISHRFSFNEVLSAFQIAGTPESAKVMVAFS